MNFEKLKNLFNLAFVLIFSLAFAACSSDSNSDEDGGADKPEETLIQRSCTVKEGDVLDPAVNVITINYSQMVNISPNANITLNGAKVTATPNAKTVMSIDIAVALESNKDYTLIVPSGAVTAKENANRVAKEFVVNFKTKIVGLPDNTAMQVTRKLGFGWNLGNHFDSYATIEGVQQPVPDSWGSWWDKATPTEALYQNLAKNGVKTVRMPVTWGPFEGAAPAYTIDANFMTTVKQNVIWAKNAGLNVILNTHHDEYWLDIYSAAANDDKNKEIVARIEATWRQIAEEFKNEGEYLFFETFNEIHAVKPDGSEDWGQGTAKQHQVLNEWNQIALNTIRNTGAENAKRWVMVCGYAANIELTIKNLTLPSDPAGKLIVAAHCYDPYGFTLSDPLQTEYWGHNAGNAYDEKNIVDQLNKLKEKYIYNNIPCYLGEMGCSKHTSSVGEKCRSYYLEYFCRAAHEAGLAVCVWDNYNKGTGSEHHAYFDHNNGVICDGNEKNIQTMVEATTSDNPSYTLESVYNRAPSK